jgi:hypothetical protein
MANYKPLPSAEYLREVFDYDEETGLLNWSAKSKSSWRENPIRGNLTGQRYKVKLDKNTWFVHRIIWKMQTGQEPPPILDHADGDVTNNRMGNLRPATPSQNSQNTSMLLSRGVSKLRGVFPTGTGKWQAQIQKDKVSVYLGTYNTPEEAHVMYRIAASKLFKEFFRGDF